MLIDFHVHTFPESIADKALSVLLRNMRETYNIDQKLYYGGTPELLLEDMNKCGVDISVVMPIATKVTQYKTINSFAKSIQTNRIISFASLHPYQENVDGVLCEIEKNNFKGIKLHPDYQGVRADDEKFIYLVRKATEKGLYVTIHSGEDTGIKPPFCGTVDKMKTLINKVDDSFLILAHMGAFNQWDEVEELFSDTNAYFDTSVVSRFIDINQYKRIIEKHGADKILFGSDSPWESPVDTLEFLRKSGVSDEEVDLITYKNAEKILGIG